MRIYKPLMLLLAAVEVATIVGSLLAKPSAVNAESGDGAPPVATDNGPIRTWITVFVDATTKQPLPGILVDTSVAIPEEAELQDRLLISDESGEIKIPLRKGQCTTLNIRGPGWCYTSGIPIVGALPAEWREKDAPPQDPDKPIRRELYRGTEVKGRLLLPDGGPAAGVTLIAGVHCNRPPWISQAYIENRMRHTYSVSEWPNWDARTTTGEDGSFSITVPPPNARGWIRLGTTPGDFTAIDTSRLEKARKNHPLVRFAPLVMDINGRKSHRQVDESSGVLDLGELQLSKGIVLRGRVVDAHGGPLSGVHLHTSSRHGPYAGRKTVSRSDGSFEFMPMNAGTFRLSPDAHFRDEKGVKNSRDVQAVFVSQEVTLNEAANPHELIVRALPHVVLEFEWIDRRAEKGPVSYYGGFTLTGKVPGANGSKANWRGETDKVTRDGKEFLVVKVPEAVVGLTIGLHPDQRVTPTYSDDMLENVSGQVMLGDVTRPMQRMIFGDESRDKSKEQSK